MAAAAQNLITNGVAVKPDRFTKRKRLTADLAEDKSATVPPILSPADRVRRVKLVADDEAVRELPRHESTKEIESPGAFGRIVEQQNEYGPVSFRCDHADPQHNLVAIANAGRKDQLLEQDLPHTTSLLCAS